jgi:tripeptide aminopeptidase
MYIATEFINSIPRMESPEHTEGYEGFFHLHDIKGDVEETVLQYIIRDHDKGHFEARKEVMQKLTNELNSQYGREVITTEIKDQYYNMKEKVEPVMHIVDIAEEAMKQVGIEPLIKAIRGGTDGSQLSYMGLPCPNIFAGGHNFHGRYEYVPVESMIKATEVICKIAELTALKNDD